MSVIPHYDLNHQEQTLLKEVAETLANELAIDDEELIISVCLKQRCLYQSSLSGLTDYIAQQFQHNKYCGAVMINNIPTTHHPKIVTTMLAHSLGKVIKEYAGGVWIKQIKVESDFDAKIDRPSARDTREFHLHTDLTYITTPPSYFLFNCVSNPPALGGASIFCGLENIIEKLSPSTIEILQEKIFLFPTPYYYVGVDTITNAILSKDEIGRYVIRFRRDGLRAMNKAGMNAISEIKTIMDKELIELNVQENSALYINNQRCLHGRMAFLQMDNTQRHFLQLYIE